MVGGGEGGVVAKLVCCRQGVGCCRILCAILRISKHTISHNQKQSHTHTHSLAHKIITAKDFEPLETYTIALRLRNSDRVARRVKVMASDVPYFAVAADDPKTAAVSRNGDAVQSAGKVAPGMEVVFSIEFRPDELRDYGSDLVVVTEREKFLVPVRAVGPRPVLDFPNQIVFTSVAVKQTATQTVFVRNLGLAPAAFSLHATLPFNVTPLKVGSSLLLCSLVPLFACLFACCVLVVCLLFACCLLVVCINYLLSVAVLLL